MEVALQPVLLQLVGDGKFEIHPFQCKDDLLKNLPNRLRSYSHWLPPHWAVLVLVDRDDDHCQTLKQPMEATAETAGLVSKTRAGQGNPFQVVNRIVVEELEAWFFGDWRAVQAAYPRVPATIPARAKFRNPDAILGTWEALERILKQAGYFKTGLRKMECARTVAQQMDPARNTSDSFLAFVDAVNAAIAWV
ncbi:MAG: DUF4276 family protein [Magnetococcales bacterium]|nr:DUF4276 family protein [Magnetococcales bacterium]